MSKRKIEVSSASLTALKAEISRRQLEIKEKAYRLDDGCTVLIKNGDKSAFFPSNCVKKPSGADNYPCKAARSSKAPFKMSLPKIPSDSSSNLTADDLGRLEKSRRQLEAKAKLYAALKEAARIGRHSTEADEDSGHLVDFEKKVQEEARLNCDMDTEKSLSGHNTNQSQPPNYKKDRPPDPISETDDDSDTEDHTPQRNGKHSSGDDNDEVDSISTKDTVTYADLREGEIRDHGVGFYAFSKDVAEREKEMARLLELRRATEAARQRVEEVRARHDAKLGARLARLRARKGLPDAAEAAAQCLQQQQEEEPDVPVPQPSSLLVPAQASDSSLSPLFGESSALPTLSNTMNSSEAHIPTSPVDSFASSATMVSPVASTLPITSSDMPVLEDFDLDVVSMLRRLRDEAEAATTMASTHHSAVSSIDTSSDLVTLDKIAPLVWRGRKLGTRMREWDRGKSLTSAQRYIEERRMERNSAFAPP